jgi:hypothetical protein
VEAQHRLFFTILVVPDGGGMTLFVGGAMFAVIDIRMKFAVPNFGNVTFLVLAIQRTMFVKPNNRSTSFLIPDGGSGAAPAAVA